MTVIRARPGTAPSDPVVQRSDKRGRSSSCSTTNADARTRTPATAKAQSSSRRKAHGAEGALRKAHDKSATSTAGRADAPRRSLSPVANDAQRAFDRRITALNRDVAAGVRGAREELAAVTRDRDGVQKAIHGVEAKLAASTEPGARAQLTKELEHLNAFGVKVAGMNPKERQDLANFFRMAETDPVGLQRFLDAQRPGAPAAPAQARAPAAPVEAPPPAQASSGIQAAIDFGMSQLGAPYVGGASPFRFGTPGDGRTYQMDGQRAYVSQQGVVGFDCSGLMVTMLKKSGIDISQYSSSRAMKANLPQVPKDQLQPGDLLVKNGHVSMYIGNGQMIESVPSGVRVADANAYVNNAQYTAHRPG